MTGHHVQASRLVPVEPAEAFDRLIGAPLPELFSRRFAAFPPVREVVDQPLDWGGTTGQERTIVMTDGGRLHETITALDRPHGYTYRLDDIHGPLRPFVHTVEGSWSVAPEDGGSRVTWAWTIFPSASLARLTPLVIGRMWQGYAARALAELESLLVGAVGG
jgi:hypothetical protein